MARAWKVRGLKPDMSLRQVARRVLGVHIAEFYSYAPFIHDPARVTELHDMRIAAKRLRYTLELFRAALPPAAAGVIEQVKDMQEVLGQIHDADVLEVMLQERLATIAHEAEAALLARLHDEPDEAARLAAILPNPLRRSAGRPSPRVRSYAARIRGRMAGAEPWVDCLKLGAPGGRRTASAEQAGNRRGAPI